MSQNSHVIRRTAVAAGVGAVLAIGSLGAAGAAQAAPASGAAATQVQTTFGWGDHGKGDIVSSIIQKKLDWIHSWCDWSKPTPP
ncbi:hypothetical protein, partial [Microbacterium sp.]